MRPINLKVQGINSYVTEQEVKFDKLAESKLFGIFGETGSGKTTILDAIVLALYGTSEREAIGNMINVNCKNAHVYFDFVENVNGEDVLFRVKRDYKLRDSGVKQDALLTEVVTGKVLADMTESVNDEVLKIIGVGKKEFLKCIALPQGEFDRFLVDTPANRKKTIAKLFNLEHFGVVLQEKIKNRKDITTLKLENVKDKLALYEGVTQEALYSSHITLKTKQKRLKEVEKEIALTEKKYNQLCADYDLSLKLVDAMAQLTVRESEEKEVNALRRQVEHTEKFGNLIAFVTRKNAYVSEIAQLEPKLKADKKLLQDTNKQLLGLVDELSKLQEQKQSVDAEYATASVEFAKYTQTKETIEELRAEYSKIAGEAKELESGVKELSEKLGELQVSHDEQVKSRANIKELVENNKKLLEKIRESKTVETVDGFVDYLTYLKSLIDPDALQEIYQFDVFEQINAMLLSMQKYELDIRKKVAGIKSEYNALLKYGKDLNSLQSQIEKKNEELNATLAKVDASIEKSGNLIVTVQTQILERNNQIDKKKHELQTIKVKHAAREGELKEFEDISRVEKLKNQVDKLQLSLDELSSKIASLTESKNNLVVSVEVESVNLDNLNANLKEVNATIRTLKIDENEHVDEKYNLSPEELQAAKERVAEFDKAVGVLENIIKETKSKIVNKNVTKIEVETFENSLNSLREEQNRISVKIGVLTEKLEKLKADLEVVKQLTKEKDDTQKAYDTVMKLSALITGGGLLEYVAEEYMSLITEFANKFVYQISKGKYLLRYNGEFFVLDNFNGGIPRGVKTLSGGERFIISLSLALGISQSISVNNNRAFNFFFIDEGFGSLSDDYIENVLNSFNELIKLDFTVGFITHVDRMQEFINNRIIVTKPNNEVGTQIKQYF
ncbi:MAG: SMC family ATPase [Clostridia bacterium]|nr:SMC family ATPase [Clostridia bacterium]